MCHAFSFNLRINGGKRMITVSLCMIVKNEEDVLERCLNSVKGLMDEIIIVDTGSTDKTKEIARKFTDKIYDFEWIDDFSAARNYAFQQATKEYIFWMDADDVMVEQEKFKRLKEELSSKVDAVSMLYHIAFDEYNNPTFSYRRNRLVKREKNFVWKGAVHEYLEVSGQILESDIALIHREENKEGKKPSDRNLRIYEKRLANGDTFTPRDVFYFANELRDHRQFEKAIELYEKFLQMEQGWKEDKIRACIHMASCYRALGNMEKEIDYLLKSIDYDVPRPEVSCRMGDLYLERGLYDKAIMWYELAIMADTSKIQGFVQTAYSTWYPCLQLCVCHWHKGNKELAIEYNKKAKEFRPNDPAVQYNEQFFSKEKSKAKEKKEVKK